MRVVEDHRELERIGDRLAVRELRAPAREGQDPVDDLERALRVARQLVAQVQLLHLLGDGVERGRRPAERVHAAQEAEDLLDSLVGVLSRGVRRLDPDTAPAVVAHHHVERLEHRPGQEIGERDEGRSALAVGRGHEVEDVAVKDELAGGASPEHLAHLLGPRRQAGLRRPLTHSVLLGRADYPRRQGGALARLGTSP